MARDGAAFRVDRRGSSSIGFARNALCAVFMLAISDTCAWMIALCRVCFLPGRRELDAFNGGIPAKEVSYE